MLSPVLYSLATLAEALSVSRSWAEKQHAMSNIPGAVKLGTKLVRFEGEAVAAWAKLGCPRRGKWPEDWRRRWPKKYERRNQGAALVE